MGGGTWSTETYTEREETRRASGRSAFGYDDELRSRSRREWTAHESLNPLGVELRESRDNEEHPQSHAVTVLFDVTGSMGGIPVVLQQKLRELLGLLLRKGYIEHPHIMFGAVGDAVYDRVPLQIGQWESDNRMDENLENLVLEGGGGPYITESYELAMYFMARHTAMDCWEKRGEKGYLFLIGDEMAYDKVKRNEVSSVIGDPLQSDIPTSEIVAELKERFHVFFILPHSAGYGGERKILDYWRGLLGQNVIELDNPEVVCETIALAIGMSEGVIDLSDGVDDLEDIGVSKGAIDSATKALDRLSKGSAVAKSDGNNLPGLSSDKGDSNPTKRL